MKLTQVLGNVSAQWLDSHTSWRPAAIDALQVSTGYSQTMVERAIADVFEAITESKLEAFAQAHSIVPVSTPSIVLHIAAGNVFTAWLQGAVITLLLGHRAWIKPSSSEPVFAGLWKKSIAETDLALSQRIQVFAWDDSLRDQADAVVAYGDDETLAKLRNFFRPIPFMAYGHKISFAVAFEESMAVREWPAWRDRATADIEPFQLKGCLSPRVLYVEGESLRPWLAMQSVFPFPELKKFRRLTDLVPEVRKYQNVLSCIGYAGRDERVEELKKTFPLPESIRLCKLGEMQRPSLDWKNGGLSLVDELRKIARAS